MDKNNAMSAPERELLLLLAYCCKGEIIKELTNAGMAPNEGCGGAVIQRINKLIKKINNEDQTVNNKDQTVDNKDQTVDNEGN